MNIEHPTLNIEVEEEEIYRKAAKPQSRKGRQGTQRRKRGGMKFLILDFEF